MKKSLIFLSVLVVMLSGLLFTSCDLVEELSGPKDTWCEMYVEYGAVNLVVNAIYVDEEYKGKGSSSSKKTRAQLSPEITLQPGITFVVTLGADSDNEIIEGLSETAYIMKNFPINSDVELDDDGNKFKFKGSYAKWNALYLAKKELRDEDNQTPLPGAPDILTYTSVNNGSTPLNDPEGFSWSKLLRNYFLNSLLNNLE